MAYTWIVVCGGIAAGAMAWGIGANDLANAFGTTYGAGVLTQKQIAILASVCEFGGAFALGSQVTKTIAGNITSIDHFIAQPYVFMYGMLSALVAATSWTYLATYLELAVSTTHSIIGGIMGFALVSGGGHAITWVKSSSEFPYMTGVIPVVVSWFSSPILAAGVSASIFGGMRRLILRHPNSNERALYIFPVALLFTTWINIFFVLSKGAKDRLHWPIYTSSWVAGVASAGAGLAGIAAMPWLRRYIHRQVSSSSTVDGRTPDVEPAHASKTETETEAARAIAIEQHHPLQSEQFHPDTEACFKFLQVFTAICMSFAHGANDVSNAIGPFAAIYNIHATAEVASSNDVPLWMLGIGGSGLVLGLTIHGLRIMRVLGTKLTHVTPTRGFAAELATGLVVSFASSYGMPISTTHCITGAIIGVGLVDGVSNVDWRVAGKTFTAWIGTLAVSGVLSAALFAQGVYAPSV